MANEVLIKQGTAIILADVTDHSPTAGASLSGTRTDQIDLTSLADGSYRQSDKFDFTTPRGNRYAMRAAIEFGSAPTAGATVDFYLGYSDSATAANNNPGNLSGSDGAYVGYGAAAGDADEAAPQLEYIGSLVCTADADIQIAEIGIFIPRLRYGILAVKNGSGQALQTDAVEMSVHLQEIIDEVQ